MDSPSPVPWIKESNFGETLEYVREVLPLNTFFRYLLRKSIIHLPSPCIHGIDPWNVNLQAFREEVGDHLGQAILLGIDNAILFRYLAIESDTVFHPALEGLV